MKVLSMEYCVGIPELFSLNWNRDPCVKGKEISCANRIFASKVCPVGVDFFRFPSGELRLDFAHCNLNCIPCWAKQCPHEEHFNCYQSGYGLKESFSAEEIVDRIVCRAQKLNDYVEAKKSFQIRITGGEPFFSQERWNHIVEILYILDRRVDPKQPDYSRSLGDRLHDYGPRGQPKRKRVVIQTNGILLGNLISINELTDTVRRLKRLNILLHHSIKGSKPLEFHLLTKANENLFTHQVKLISELSNVRKSLNNFDFQVVFGFFHSDKYILWNPEENKPMLTEPESFFLNEVKRNWQRTYVEPLDFRLRMIEKARTTERCLDKAILKKKSHSENRLTHKLEPLPRAGRKTRIDRTFWANFL